MILFDAPVSPDALTAFVRRVPTPSNLALSAMFPTTYRPSNTFDWSEVTKTNRTARYRAFDGRIHTSKRDGAGDKKVNLPPLSTSLNMGEYERLQLEFARTGGTRTQALADAVYNDAEQLAGEIINRGEQAWGDVLTDGKLTINENGLQAEADFGMPANHLVASVATAWTNAAATILDNLTSWVNIYTTTNGFAPGSILTSRKVAQAINSNTQVINAAIGAAAGRTWADNVEVTRALQARGLPSSITQYDTVLDIDGVTTRVIPEDRVILLPPDLATLSEFRYGLTATALELVRDSRSQMTFEDGPGIAAVVDKVGPPYREFTFVDAVGMPILRDARLLFAAKVY